jgi:hypothetical protein
MWTETGWRITALLRPAIVCTGQRTARSNITMHNKTKVNNKCTPLSTHGTKKTQQGTECLLFVTFPWLIITVHVSIVAIETHSFVTVGATQWLSFTLNRTKITVLYTLILAERPKCYWGEIRQMLTFLINLYCPKARHRSDHSIRINE